MQKPHMKVSHGTICQCSICKTTYEVLVSYGTISTTLLHAVLVNFIHLTFRKMTEV